MTGIADARSQLLLLRAVAHYSIALAARVALETVAGDTAASLTAPLARSFELLERTSCARVERY